MKRTTNLKAFLISFIFTLTACGGSGSSNTEPSKLTGFWTGSVSKTGENNPQDSIALISEYGKAFFLTEGDLSVGNFSTSNNKFNGSFVEYFEDGGTGTGNLTGTYFTKSLFQGSALQQEQTTSTFSFTYESSNNRTPDLQTISGIYSDTSGSYTETYTIDTDGNLTGSDTDGCIFAGALTIPNSNNNIYKVKLTASNCSAGNGTYTGFGTLIDNLEANDTLLLAIESPDFVLFGDLTRT